MNEVYLEYVMIEKIDYSERSRFNKIVKLYYISLKFIKRGGRVMSISDLYNGIYSVLSNDATVLSYLGITDEDELGKANHIQKRAKPQGLDKNMPLITFYAISGYRENSNSEAYVTNFVFAIYTEDDIELAHKIAQRIIDLFEGEFIPFNNMVNFQPLFTSAAETESDSPNIYSFSVVIQFYMSMEKVY